MKNEDKGISTLFVEFIVYAYSIFDGATPKSNVAKQQENDIRKAVKDLNITVII